MERWSIRRGIEEVFAVVENVYRWIEVRLGRKRSNF